ncbi:phage head closure protein [Paracoccus sp. NSM]|uniref:phage head closure protein n=1 Tax=Paracoccus sp. NSM TaxID=3457784 RepID=UPI004035B0A6
MMRSGKLIETIRIETPQDSVNDYGTPTTGWTPRATVRAERIDQTTEEYMRSHGASDEEAVSFRIRHLDSVANADRVIWKGQPFEIRQITPIGRRKGLELRCVRVTP